MAAFSIGLAAALLALDIVAALSNTVAAGAATRWLWTWFLPLTMAIIVTLLGVTKLWRSLAGPHAGKDYSRPTQSPFLATAPN